jgi:hypothetical protein
MHRSAVLLVACSLLVAPASAQWSSQSLSAPRTDLAAATVGDLAFFAGGLDWQTSSAAVDIYDSAADSWTQASLVVPRSHLAATAVGPYLLFAGGAVDQNTDSAVVDVYDSSKGPPDDATAWSQASLSQARYAPAATTVGSQAIFAGGATGGLGNPNAVATAVVDIYDASVGPPSDPAAWSIGTSLSHARGLIAATTAGSQAIFAGGFDGVSASAVVDIYDATTGKWSVASLSQARKFRGASPAAAVGSRAYFGGGESSAGVMTATVDIYDAQDGTWAKAQLSSARGAIAASALGSTVLFAGGVKSGFVPSATVDLLDSGTGHWSLGTLSQPRAALCAATLADRSLFAGGTSGPGSPHAEVDVYEPVGLNYCVATANSTGCAASIYATGSKSVASNDLVLSSSCMPNGVFLFFHATNQVQLPFGDGLLCAGGGVVRILPPGFATGGLAEVSVDLPSVGITGPGVRNFQCWFRDPTAGNSGFNTSDALAVTFLP